MPPFLRHYLVTCLLQLRVYSVEPTCAPNRSELILSARPCTLSASPLYAVGPHLRPYPVRPYPVCTPLHAFCHPPLRCRAHLCPYPTCPYPVCTPLSPSAGSSTLSGLTCVLSGPSLSCLHAPHASGRLLYAVGPHLPSIRPGPLPDQPLAAEREIAVPCDNQMIQQTNIEQSRRLRNTFGQHLVLSTRGGSSRRMIMDQNELRGQ